MGSLVVMCFPNCMAYKIVRRRFRNILSTATQRRLGGVSMYNKVLSETEAITGLVDNIRKTKLSIACLYTFESEVA